MKNKKYYPVFLDIQNRPCLVTGGGTIAQRKVEGLLAYGAKITVVSPFVTPKLEQLALKKKIIWTRAKYHTSDLKGMVMAIGATSDMDANKKLFHDAEAKNIPVNIVDELSCCRFIAPSVMKRGNIQIAISTGGASPLVAKKIREKLEKSIGPEYVVLSDVLKKMRSYIKTLPEDKKKKFWEKIAGLNLQKYKTDPAELKNLVIKWMEEAK
jgi:siroheme synthase-like protein